MSECGSERWQVVEITGVGVGELWHDVVADDLDKDVAARRARKNVGWVAVPMPGGEPA